MEQLRDDCYQRSVYTHVAHSARACNVSPRMRHFSQAPPTGQTQIVGLEPYADDEINLQSTDRINERKGTGGGGGRKLKNEDEKRRNNIPRCKKRKNNEKRMKEGSTRQRAFGVLRNRKVVAW